MPARAATTTSAPRSIRPTDVAPGAARRHRPARRRRAGLLAAALALGAAPGAWALAIESCVSTDALQIAAADRHAWLDDADRDAAAAAIGARFPLLARDGFAPSELLLWDRPRQGWVYVAVIVNPERPGERCFTATISFDAVPAARSLLRKYFPEVRDT